MTRYSFSFFGISCSMIFSMISAIFEEIKESENFENALRFAEIIENIIEHEIPKNEKEYLVINGCLLMEQ